MIKDFPSGRSPDLRDAAALREWALLCCLVLSIAAAVLQDGPQAFWALANSLPVQAHKYIGFDAIVQFYPWKVFKYVFFLIAVALCLGRPARTWVREFFRGPAAPGVLAYAVAPSLLIAATGGDPRLLVAGLKAWLPVAALLIGLQLTPRGLAVLERTTHWLLIAATAVAVFQVVDVLLFWELLLYNAVSFASGGQRTTGTFAEPSTLAAFALARVAIMLVTRRLVVSAFVLALIVLYVSASRTTLGAVIITLGWLFFTGSREPRNRWISAIVASTLVAGMAIAIYTIHLRGLDSLWARFDIARDRFTDVWALVFGSGFGVGTISSQTLGHLSPDLSRLTFVTDSLYTGLVAQGGVWMLAGFLAWLFILWQRCSPRSAAAGIIMALLVQGVGTNIIEVWPCNIILLVLIGYCLRPGNAAEPGSAASTEAPALSATSVSAERAIASTLSR